MTNHVVSYSGAKMRIPDYDAESITNLPIFFQDTLLGEKTSVLSTQVTDRVNLDGINNVVCLLVDGFGARQWNFFKAELEVLQKFERSGYLSFIDSVFPSSTPVALNALHANGMTPLEHGLVDWWMYVEEIDKIIATLPFSEMGSAKIDSLLKLPAKPAILLNARTTYEEFKKKGIASRVFIHKDYSSSVYSKLACKGSDIIPHEDIEGLFSTLGDCLSKRQRRPSYNFVYWGDIDAAGHKYGLDSEEYMRAVKEYFIGLEAFLTNVDNVKNTLLIITADHGQINIDSRETIFLDSLISGLDELLMISPNGQRILPWGGRREVFLPIKGGWIDEALSLLQATIGGSVELLKSNEALRSGLFGNISDKLHPSFKSRIGDIIVLPKVNQTVWYHHPGEERPNLRGHHGGLSEDELKVPFGVLRIN